jgi:hypothetical protein
MENPMPPMTAAWITVQMLGLSTEALKRAFSPLPLESVACKHHNRQSALIKAIIRAHYNEALMFVKENQPSKALDASRKAVAIDELDIDARRLFIEMLRVAGDYESAAKYSVELLNLFGFRGDCVPAEVFQAYRKKYFELPLPFSSEGNSSLVIRCHGGDYPTQMWCARSALTVHSSRNRSWLGRKLLGDPDTVLAHSWTGAELVKIPEQHDGHIVALTNEYVVLKQSATSRPSYSVYRLSTGEEVITATSGLAGQSS